MRNILRTSKLLIAFCLLFSNVKSQNKIVEQVIKAGNAQKTGNWQDVFTNFFQVAVKDLTGNDRSFEFKSTLFALRLKLDPSLSVDTNYVKHAFDRNFQFNTSLKLDTQYKFRSFSAGFTWAIVNKRDSTILSFIGKEEDLLFDRFSQFLTDALIKYKMTVSKEKYDTVQTAISAMMGKGKIELDNLPDDFKLIANKKIEDNFNAVVKAISDELASIRMKPLLTLSVNTAFKKGNGLFNGGDAEIVYLQGVTKNKKPIELDMRLNYKTTDTLINNVRYRNEIGFKGGINIGVASSRGNDAPLIEIKPHIEYKRILKGLISNEKETMLSANATARVRLARNLWIPLTLKYDLDKNNFLGFLNVTFNWDAFKK
jgi:hypothetical protein